MYEDKLIQNKIVNTEESNIFANFLSSNSKELVSKVSHLDDLIGRDHWLSVGNYKESILRNLLSSTLPKKYEVSTGFIIASDREGKILKSKQIDIIVWDSTNYAPIFRDGEFAIVPPEACSAIIEVKSKLNSKELYDSLLNIDSLTSFPIRNHIGKYIFAYDIGKECKFPDSLWQMISNNYNRGEYISLKERMDWSNTDTYNGSIGNHLFSVDAIFVLSSGVIIRELIPLRNEKYPISFQFEAYSTKSDNHEHTYAFFENHLQAHLATNGKSGLQYAHQPDLYSVKRNINVSRTSPKWLMIFPPIEPESMPEYSIDKNTVFVPNKIGEDNVWTKEFSNFERAFLLLQDSLKKEQLSVLERAGLIQFFEKTFKLSWILLKDYGETEKLIVNAPKAVSKKSIEQAFQAELISNEHDWIDALQDRKLTARPYNEKIAIAVEAKIRSKYCQLFTEVYAFFKNKIATL